MANKTKTTCDNCNKEYTKGQYGNEGVLDYMITTTNSCPEKMRCRMDLCETCISKVNKAINSVLQSDMKFKSEGMGVYH